MPDKGMALLDKLFSRLRTTGPAPQMSIVELRAIHADELAHWRDYLATVDKKATLLASANPSADDLMRLIDIDMADIEKETIDNAAL